MRIERLERVVSELDQDYAKNPRYAVVLHGILTPTECQNLIDISEQREYEQALVNIGGGNQAKMDDLRNNDRAIIDDQVTAELIWKRIATALTKENEAQLHQIQRGDRTWRAVGLNERLRFLRYDPGTFFGPHMDGSYSREDPAHPQYGHTSFVTAQIYLNGGFEGGATRFLNYRNDKGYDVVPNAGSILLFQHNIVHEGSVLLKGRKYTIRTDIMYEPLS